MDTIINEQNASWTKVFLKRNASWTEFLKEKVNHIKTLEEEIKAMDDQCVKDGETIKEKNERIEELSIPMGLMDQEIKNCQNCKNGTSVTLS